MDGMFGNYYTKAQVDTMFASMRLEMESIKENSGVLYGNNPCETNSPRITRMFFTHPDNVDGGKLATNVFLWLSNGDYLNLRLNR